MKTVFYKSFIKNLLTQKINIDNDSFRLILLKPNYTFEVNESSYDDIKAYELDDSNSGYTKGGKNISLSMVSDVDDKFIFVRGNNILWDSFSSTFKYAVLAKEEGDLVCCIDFESANTVDRAQLSLEWGSQGIFKFDLTQE